MRLFNNSIYLWLLLLLPFFLCTCKKRDEQLIVGVWNVETFTLQPPLQQGYWVFDGDGRFKIYHDDPSNENGDTASGTYEIVMKSLVLAHLQINNPLSFRGLWRIERLNKDVLVISRVAFLEKSNKSDPYFRREFIRSN